MRVRPTLPLYKAKQSVPSRGLEAGQNKMTIPLEVASLGGELASANDGDINLLVIFHG